MAMIELSYEQKGLVIQDVLMNDFENLSREIAELSSRSKNLDDFEVEDLEDMTKYRKAMKRLLRYYMVRAEADEFIASVEGDIKLIEDEVLTND
jgi:hypothetical protein